MTDLLYRPIVRADGPRSEDALPLAGGPFWFSEALCLPRHGAPSRIAARDLPEATRDRLSGPRAPVAGLTMDRPQIMGILNVTPDSFSDGGAHFDPTTAISTVGAMLEAGATLIDIGGESTRPGAVLVPAEEEAARILPVIEGLQQVTGAVISVDTRKAAVARPALAAGAHLINDVSGFAFDPDLAPLCAETGVPVCVMHSQGDPETMQNNPSYDSVLHDVFDALDERIRLLEAAGIPRSRIIADPGIGFGKTLEHNVALLRDISVFHGLGCAILLGVSRKGFIGRIGKEPRADARAPGSIAVGLAALGQGVHILRVHDVAETAQAVRLWQAVQHPA
ncbi:dihydropteroate synthase [Marinibacterium profundimaris]|uniref:Dihydropteroate synthase n=1 Tax=Marinibacterium profundimaris TaxID=1679460 RepID=A0A225NNJ6_9RHOB|nr:dihydropteroate synthase [Marinibacterium profundimaris]OWU72620.1 dihydropteroate synthase [Marinibacterium profundimaris]